MVRTLHVRIESQVAFDDRIAAKLRSVEAGQLAELDGESVLSLPDADAVETVFGGKNLELVRTIAVAEPESIRELARHVDRDIKNVSRAVNRLAEIGVVDLAADGRAKRPRVPYDEIELTYRLRDPDADAELPA